jgi:hypothetical protein
MNRQSILERAGWLIWRCFASTWTLRKDEVLFELCGKLNAMGIEPLGSLEQTTSLVEKRVWRMRVKEDSVTNDAAAPEDETGVSRAIIDPSLFERHRALLSHGKFLQIEGSLQTQDNDISVKAFDVMPLAISAMPVQSHDFH